MLREWEDEPGGMTDEDERELVALHLISNSPETQGGFSDTFGPRDTRRDPRIPHQPSDPTPVSLQVGHEGESPLVALAAFGTSISESRCAPLRRMLRFSITPTMATPDRYGDQQHPAENVGQLAP